MDYFVGQGNVKISLDTGIDITTATNLRILFKRPNGSIGFWPGARNGTSIEYSVQNTDFDQPGEWSFQASCSLSGQNALGSIVRKKILAALNTP